VATPALIKQAELRRMANIAKSEGVCVSVEVNGKIFTVSPDIPDNHKREPVALPDDYAF
jgi:hypothetical protein